MGSSGDGRREAFMSPSTALVDLADYRPSDDEPFMNERQLAYFKRKLMDWRDDILRESRETVSHLQLETVNHPDRRRPRLVGDRPLPGAAHAGPAAQADLQDRRGIAPDRGGRLRLLRGDRRADRPREAGGPPDRDTRAGSAGAPRAARAGAPRRLRPLDRLASSAKPLRKMPAGRRRSKSVRNAA